MQAGMVIRRHFCQLLSIAVVLFGTSVAAFAGGSLKGWGSNTDIDGNFAGKIDVPAGENYIALGAGGKHGIALRANGSIVGWGSNTNADGDYVGQAVPPEGNDYVAIAAGIWNNLALKADGSIIGWGDDSQGQVSDIPEGNDFVAIAAAGAFCLALKSDGSIVGWGENTNGQADPPAGTGYQAIAAGPQHALAIAADGSLVAWGYNSNGQTDVPAGNEYVAVAAGLLHSLALRSDGSIVGWGDNRLGQTNVPTGTGHQAIAAGYLHNIAITSDGSLTGWGTNFKGERDVPAGNDFEAIDAGFEYSLALKTKYVNLTVNLEGQGQVIPDGGAYPVGDVASLQAVPETGWDFERWEGAANGTDPSVRILMDASKTATAFFKQAAVEPEPNDPNQPIDDPNDPPGDPNEPDGNGDDDPDPSGVRYGLTVEIRGEGRVAPTGGSYPATSIVTVMAVPDRGWRFVGWQGDARGTTRTIDLFMDSEKQLVAVFKPTDDGAGQEIPEGVTDPAGCGCGASAPQLACWWLLCLGGLTKMRPRRRSRG